MSENDASNPLSAKTSPGKPVQRWLDVAEFLKPTLHETIQEPIHLVRAVRDESVVLRYRMDVEAPAAALRERVLRKGDSVVIDFGGHRTGNLSFRLNSAGRAPDSPARIRFTFGEVPSDVAESFLPYSGHLSQAWLPDEIVNIDDLPTSVRLPRRYAFRYVRIDIIDTSSAFGVIFEDVKAHALSAAKHAPAPLPATVAPLLRRIDEISIATLRDCLQTIFEDGPRRDRRLWVGDLRLQALTNYATFQANDVVKRCLYLFAALPRADGLMNACIFEKPTPIHGEIVIFDYAALYNIIVADYVAATGDTATGLDLWPVVKRQLEVIGTTVNSEGLFVDPGGIWLFIDWARELDRRASIQGVLIYAYVRTLELAQRLGLASEVADYPGRIELMRRAARNAFLDRDRGVFLSGPERQISWASQAWLTIAEVPASKVEAAAAIRFALADPTAVKPTTPYLYHYVADAMLTCGMGAEATQFVEDYWGGMVKAGADTFWEVYDPANALSSPYGDIHINSYCHAWSCTPEYLIRARALG